MHTLARTASFALAVAAAATLALPQSPAAKHKSRPAQQERTATRAEVVPAQPQRIPFTASDQALAQIPGIADARFWADSVPDFTRALPVPRGPWLTLSAGGADGAYAAGFLNGWTASGARPEFSVVIGSSIGALVAPFAFLGPEYDPVLREQFTRVTAADVFEAGATPDSLLDTWPLRELIGRHVTPKLLADVAAAHQAGRRLFVLTANLDAERPVIWNMGAIAAHGDEAALKLFRDVLLASAAIPGVFPPVYIDAEANGQHFREMHADGALAGPFFVAPLAALSATSPFRLPASELYIVLNSKLTPDFGVTDRSPISVLGRSFSVALKGAARVALANVYPVARRSDTAFKLTYIDAAFAQPSRGAFDPDYMQALFDFGAAKGRDGAAFHEQPPAPAAERAVVGQ